MIYILTGAVQTGKSTAISKWIQGKNTVVGILSMVNAKGTRDFINIRNQENFSMHGHKTDSSSDVIQVGKFTFSKLAFEKANSVIAEESQKTDYQYLVVDELGKLELKKEGLYASTINLIKPFENSPTKHLILVIRDYLLHEIVNEYRIKTYQTLDKSQLYTI